MAGVRSTTIVDFEGLIMKSCVLFKIGNFNIHYHKYINEFSINIKDDYYKSVHIWHLEFIWFRPKYFKVKHDSKKK